jgi:hypothetical protein
MPAKYTVLADLGNYHMFQSFDLANGPEYVLDGASSWGVGNPDHIVILDNGAYEGEVDPTLLIGMVQSIHPDEVVCPDRPEDKATSLDLMEKWADELMALRQDGLTSSIMVVPQGKSLSEWIGCLWRMVAHFKAEYGYEPTIGVPKYLEDIADSRLNVVSYLVEQGIRPVRIHLLGTRNSPLEFARVSRVFPGVRGCDSTFPYAMAVMMARYDGRYGVKYECRWDVSELTRSQRNILEYNVAACRAAITYSQLWPVPISW